VSCSSSNGSASFLSWKVIFPLFTFLGGEGGVATGSGVAVGGGGVVTRVGGVGDGVAGVAGGAGVGIFFSYGTEGASKSQPSKSRLALIVVSL